MDLGRLQKEKQDLEQQLTEKNKVRRPLPLWVSVPALSLGVCLFSRVFPVPLAPLRNFYQAFKRSSSCFSSSHSCLSSSTCPRPLELLSRASEPE